MFSSVFYKRFFTYGTAHGHQVYSKHMTLSEELQWRGFINQTTLSDITGFDTQQWTFYHGFDASADSQTIGNLAAMMLDRCFMKHGHQAILLAGGATSLIGDPGGKDKERPLQSEESVAHNVAKAEEQLKQVFQGYEFTLENNLNWFRDMNLLWFLRHVGKHFSMTPLVQRDYIAKRMGEGGDGISYTEFSYTLLQGYDFLELHKKYGVNLQLAGSDQWGNSLSGVELVRRDTGDEVHVLTLPLIINKATGKKFGKSEEGAIWLDPGKTSVYKFYQFWLNIDDEGVEDYLKIFTELDKPAIEAVMLEFNNNRGERAAQKKLAYEVTRLVHGQEKTESVERITSVIFGQGDVSGMTAQDIDQLKDELATANVSSHDLVSHVLVTADLANSNGEARRLIEQGGVSINGEKITADRTLTQDDLKAAGSALLKRGKNQFAVIDITD
jgi:tyrosyl-tRNA synthetase